MCGLFANRRFDLAYSERGQRAPRRRAIPFQPWAPTPFPALSDRLCTSFQYFVRISVLS